jgi:hypothetical protein
MARWLSVKWLGYERMGYLFAGSVCARPDYHEM